MLILIILSENAWFSTLVSGSCFSLALTDIKSPHVPLGSYPHCLPSDPIIQAMPAPRARESHDYCGWDSTVRGLASNDADMEFVASKQRELRQALNEQVIPVFVYDYEP